MHRKKSPVGGSQRLFANAGFRELKAPVLEDLDLRQEIIDQLEILEFPLISPFHLVKDQKTSGIAALEMKQFLGKRVQLIGYLVTVKYTRTVKGDVMNFGTFIDKDGHWIDTVHFPPVVKKTPLKGRGIYLIKGKVTEEFDFYSIEVSSCERMAYWNAEDWQKKKEEGNHFNTRRPKEMRR